MPTIEHAGLSLHPADSASFEPPCVVAFDIDLGQRARAEGLVYEPDYPAIARTLECIGVGANTRELPIVFCDGSNERKFDGYFAPASTYNDGEPAVELFVRSGNPVRSDFLAHEECHAEDYLNNPTVRAYMGKRNRARKAAATICGLAAGAAVFYATKSTDKIIGQSVFAGIAGDWVLSLSLYTEYLTRLHERRARKVGAQVARENILHTYKNGETVAPATQTHRLLQQLAIDARISFIPSYKR